MNAKQILEYLEKHPVYRWLVIISVLMAYLALLPYQSVQADNHKVELVNLLHMFTLNADGTGLDWTTGASPDSPIVWDTDGVDGTVPEGVISRNCNAARHGKTTITINGKPTHDQFDKNLHPAVWNISLYGAKFGDIECVQFSSVCPRYDRHPEIMDALKQYIELDEVGPESAHLLTARLYRLSLPTNKRPCPLVESCIRSNDNSFVVALTLFPSDMPWARSFLRQLQ